MGVIDEDVVDVVLEDGGFAVTVSERRHLLREEADVLLDGGEVAAGEDIEEGCLAACTVTSAPASASVDGLVYHAIHLTYRSTSLRCTVFEPPQSGILREC